MKQVSLLFQFTNIETEVLMRLIDIVTEQIVINTICLVDQSL